MLHAVTDRVMRLRLRLPKMSHVMIYVHCERGPDSTSVFHWYLVLVISFCRPWWKVREESASAKRRRLWACVTVFDFVSCEPVSFLSMQSIFWWEYFAVILNWKITASWLSCISDCRNSVFRFVLFLRWKCGFLTPGCAKNRRPRSGADCELVPTLFTSSIVSLRDGSLSVVLYICLWPYDRFPMFVAVIDRCFYDDRVKLSQYDGAEGNRRQSCHLVGWWIVP